MITRRQWDYFCKAVDRAHSMSIFSRKLSSKITIKGQEIEKVIGHTIYCKPSRSPGIHIDTRVIQPVHQTVWRHPDSLSDYTTVDDLYNSIEITTYDTLKNQRKHA